jgi:uncharacterized protein (TIGR00266 family)
MKHKIKGDDMQILDIALNEGEEIYSEAGAMAWMTGNINMDSYMKGGIGGGIGRMFTGESLFMAKYSPSGGEGSISFAPAFPGKILPVEIKEGREIICQKDSFLAAEMSVHMKVEFKKRLGAGLFGGEGFLLQRLHGDGLAFVEIDGEVFEHELAEGEVMKIDTGCIAMFESTVSYDVERVKGIKTMLFGGEGMFLAILRGPGKIWLQSMPASSFARRIVPFLPAK